MLVDAALRRELGRSFAATLVVVLTVVLTMMLIRTLGQAAKGQAAPQDVLLLLGHAALGNLAPILALSLFVAVVLTLGRMYRDSEMVVWFCSGAPLAHFVRPVLMMATPVVCVVALLAFVGWPWVNQQGIELRERFAQRSDIARVAPGLFQSSADGRRVFFIDHDGSDAEQARNVFILSREDRGESMTTASRGRLETRLGERFVTLEDGQRNQTDDTTGERTVARFDTYSVLLDTQGGPTLGAMPPRAAGTLALWRARAPAPDGELAWRAGLVLSAVNLALLGVGMASVNPRRISNWNLLFALLAFVVYFNLLNVSKSWVAGGRIGLGAALLVLHGGVFVLAAALIAWRDQGFRMRLPGARQARA